jgi:integrase/recombinase XerD
MLTYFFPNRPGRYLRMPLMGPLMDSFASWLVEQHYTLRSGRFELRMAGRAAAYLKRRGVKHIDILTEDDLKSCYAWFRRKYPFEAGSVRVLARFLRETGRLRPGVTTTKSAEQVLLDAFDFHLREDRGYAPATIHCQVGYANEFLKGLESDKSQDRLSLLKIDDVESYIRRMAKRMGRIGLQKPVATVRNLLRFLAARGTIAPGLDQQIDRPRVFRQEQLPRALPWETVEMFLDSINRKVVIGKRDYAMFVLMATYGLRACDVVALTLDDIQWRVGCIRICQTKTGKPLELPLTDEVRSALYDYLKQPRHGSFRQIFLRLRAPAGALKPTAVTEAFQAWSRRSGLAIPYNGAQCLRHSYALNLLRKGQSLKTIGDILGHQSPESTAVYIRLATEDLRQVGLPIPACARVQEGQR